MSAADRPGDSRHRVGVAAAVKRRARVVEVHSLECGGEAVRIAFTPDLAVRDDVDPGALHVADGDDRGVVLRLIERVALHPPYLQRPCARR